MRFDRAKPEGSDVAGRRSFLGRTVGDDDFWFSASCNFDASLAEFGGLAGIASSE